MKYYELVFNFILVLFVLFKHIKFDNIIYVIKKLHFTSPKKICRNYIKT